MNWLRTGFTTGTCAAAAAKTAVQVLTGEEEQPAVEIGLPDGTRVRLPVLYARRIENGAEAAVRKDAGDDPDATHGVAVVANVCWTDGDDVTFAAGEGVGTVTRPGLQILPGEPAINPVPRAMIRNAVREVTARGVRVAISIPGGRELAAKTFNPRLGIEGGLSILGTTGVVRPFSHEALRDSLRCGVDVAAACDVRAPVFVPGHVGERAARRHFRVTAEQVVEVSNEWGFMLDYASRYDFAHYLCLGHPGKLAKLSAGEWDTHSSRSGSAVPVVAALGEQVLDRSLPESTTVEGIFQTLSEEDRRFLGSAVAENVRSAIVDRIAERVQVAVALVDMNSSLLGSAGELQPWQ